jgi:hypothetical protein
MSDMGFKEKFEQEAMRKQVRQQIRLLKAKGALQIKQHVDGRAVLVAFQYDAEMMGEIILKGSKYKMFKDEGGLDAVTDKDRMDIDAEMDDEEGKAEEAKEVKPAEQKAEVKTDEQTVKSGESKADDK